jgi:hypothetical protein
VAVAVVAEVIIHPAVAEAMAEEDTRDKRREVVLHTTSFLYPEKLKTLSHDGYERVL